MHFPTPSAASAPGSPPSSWPRSPWAWTTRAPSFNGEITERNDRAALEKLLNERIAGAQINTYVNADGTEFPNYYLMLSGGNQQKVCIARALTLNPKFLFVSEPTRGIDIGAKKIVLETLRRLNREKGISIVMVSSELEELRSICDRVAIVCKGEVVDILPPDAADADFGLAMSGIKPNKEGESA